jgi:hypothetical protein
LTRWQVDKVDRVDRVNKGAKDDEWEMKTVRNIISLASPFTFHDMFLFLPEFMGKHCPSSIAYK